MFTKSFNGRILALGVAISSSAATFVAIKAKIVNKEETIPDINSETKFQSIDNRLDLSQNKSVFKSCITRLSQWRQINNIPGFVVGVSLKGQNVWFYSEGFSDVENGVKCNDKTVMRIASISKPITTLLLAKMVEQNIIDLDKPISQYLTKDQFPDKFWEGTKVDITLRQLASHLGGIRHYKIEKKNEEKDSQTGGSNLSKSTVPEFYQKETFSSAIESLEMFKDDPLVAKPGTQFKYSTFGYTLISAVIESQLKNKNFGKYFIKFLREELGLENTYLDQNDPIIPNRSHFYEKSRPDGQLMNAPYVDSSYKWSGGGLLSNVDDLLKFGNIMLYSYKVGANGKPGLIKKETIDQMWTTVKNTEGRYRGFGGYGIGWGVIKDESAKYCFCLEPPLPHLIRHGGGAVGSSSILLIDPNNEVIVAIIANLSQVNANQMGVHIIKTIVQHLQTTQYLS